MQNADENSVSKDSQSPSAEGSHTGDAERINALRETLAAAEGGRPHDYIKALVDLAEALPPSQEKVELFAQAADLYTTRFKNQAEAVRAYEAVLAVDPHHGAAIEFLVDSYQKRRDWEKLIALRQRQAEGMDPVSQLAIYKEVALLASERIKKPSTCIELWSIVLEADPSDLEALRQLSQLYERDREYEKLSDVLESLVEATEDIEEKKKLLQKLGQVAGDRLKDEARAAEAYRQLLILEPEDRRWQEQLKKRYIALGRWDDLEMFYAQSDKWDEFIRVLESNEARAETDQERIAMLMKVAELWMTQKGKPDRAIKAYERVLTIVPDSLDAAERLVPLYEATDNAKGLTDALEVRLRHTEDPVQQYELLRRLAELYLGRANDKQRAFQCLAVAFQLFPEEEQACIDFEHAASVTGNWQGVVEAYSEALANVSAPNPLRLRIGRILLEALQQPNEALEQFEAVLAEEPSNEVALAALESIYRANGRSAELLEIYQRRVQLAEDPEQQRRLLFEMARLQELSSAEDPRDAIATYEQVLGQNPADEQALAALDRLYFRTGRFQDYAETLRRRIDLQAGEKELIDLKFRLAQVEVSHLDDAAAALDNYREILTIDPEHAGARSALEQMLGGSLRSEAAGILENIYEVSGQFDKLIVVQEIVADAATEPVRRAELLRKVAVTAAAMLGDADRAFAAQSGALALEPSAIEVRDELEVFAQRADAWPRLEKLYVKIASEVESPELARDYLLRVAAIQQQTGKVTEAAATYRKLIEIDPADNDALVALDSLLRSSGRWKDLVDVYRRRIQLAEDDDVRETLACEMASILDQQLGATEEAIAAYRETLTFAPQSRTALSALEALLSRERRWSDLSENLESQILGEADPERQVQLMLRLARLRQAEMGDAAAAIEGYKQVLEREPFNEVAIEALEQLSEDPANELVVSEILEPLYREQGNYSKLVAVYEIQERRESDPHTRVGLLHQIAGLHEDAGGDVGAAFETYCRALAVLPSDDGTWRSVDRLARATGRYQDLAQHLESLAAAQAEPDIASQLLTHAARVMERDVGNPSRAIELQRKVLAVDPTSLDAATSLQSLYQATEQYDELALILQRKVGILDDVELQKEALFQAATIEQDVLNRPEKAIAIFEKALELDPEDQRSVNALIDLHLGLEQWPELLAAQARKADLTLDPQEKKVILYQMGAVYERELNDRAKAIDTYQRVLELDPDDLEALGRLDVLHQASGNWTELLGVLSQEAELTANAEEAIGYQYRVAEIYDQKLHDVERAVELYQQILNIQPGHAATLAALERIKDSQSAASIAAANVLEPVYESIGEYQKLIGVLEVQVANADDAFTKVELLHRIASLYEEGLLSHDKAFEVYSRAVRADSTNSDSLGAVERLAMALGRWNDVAALYRSELEATDDVEQKVDLGMRVSQLFEVQLDDVDSAVAGYRAVLEVSPNNAAALTSLDRIFESNQRWNELADVLRQRADVADSPEEILEFKFRLAELKQSRLGAVTEAISTYGEILAAAPDHTGARAALEALFDSGSEQLQIAELLKPLYESSGEWDKLAEVRKAQLEHTVDPAQRLELFYRLAQDHDENLGDVEGAFEIYGAALGEFPLDERAGDEIERLAGSVDDGWVRLAVVYADIVSQEDIDPKVQASLASRLARVYEEELADVEKAKESYRFALSVAPDHDVALTNLDRIFTGLGEWSELAEVLEQRAKVTADRDDKVELLVRLGRVYEEELRQLDDAERVFRSVFDEHQPDNRDAIEALERILPQKESWRDLAKVYERQLELSVGDVEEAEIRAKMARLALNHLGDLQAATAGWRRVLELRGEDGEALQGLADLYEHQGKWAELAEVLERHYDIAESDDERVLALSRRAKLSDQQLGRIDEALDTWQRVLDIDFGSPSALLAVADIWRRKGNSQELVAALHRAVDNGEGRLSQDQVVAIQRELGQLYTGEVNDGFAAQEAWNKLLELSPTDSEAIDALDRAYRAEERWEEVVRVKMLRAAALTEPAEKVRELLEVAEIWDGALKQPDGATEAFKQIIEIDPLHERAFEQLQKLHKAASRWEELIELYLGRLEHVEEVPVRSELWRRIARVFDEKVEDKEQAFVALEQAFRDDFHDDVTLEYLGRMAHATGRWKDLISNTQQLLEEQTETKDRIRLSLCLGKWYGEDLGMMEYANSYYEQVVRLDPGSVQVMRQMANIYRLSGKWQKAADTLKQAEQAAVKNEDRKVVYVDLGDLLRKHMGEVEQGVSYYKRALAIDPQMLTALDALESIQTERGEHGELAQTLRRKLEALTNPDDLLATRLRLAELYERELRDSERAADAYQAVVHQDSTNLPALRGLERVYDSLQKWTELVDVLERQLGNSGLSERERVSILLKLAKLHEEQFLKPEDAAGRLEQVLKLDPSSQTAYSGLERCYRRLKRWTQLIDVYNRHLDELSDNAERVAILSDIGDVYSNELADSESAIDAYQKVLEAEPNHIGALDALAKLYDKRGDVHESIECLTRVADLTLDGGQRVDMYYRIGKQQLDKLQDSVDARYSFEKALDLEPSHLPSLTALRGIAQREEDWDATARYLEQEQAHTEAPRARARLLVELGRVRSDRLGETEQALSAFEQAIELDSECEDAAGPLLQNYVEQNRWRESLPLAELLVRRSRGHDRGEQHRLNNLLGRIHAELGNNEDALKAYQAAYQFDVTSQESIRGIAEVAYRLEDWPTALSNYQKVLTSLGEEETEERTKVYYRLGTIKLQQGQLKQAINNFEKALALDGEHRATLEALVGIYEKQKDWPQAAAYKRQILDSVIDEGERFDMLLDIGDVWGTKAAQPLKAIEALEEARTIRPSDHPLLHKLLKLYQEAEQWQPMVDTIHAISELEPDPERKARYFFTMAQLYRDKIQDSDRAVELFNEALDLHPGYLEAFERINKILTASKNWKQLERNYRKMLHRIAGKGQTDLEHELWYQLGLVYRDRIQDQSKALDAFKVASHTKPDDLRDRRILSELYEVNERYDEAIEQQLYVLNQDPLNLDPYRALYRLYLYKRSYDSAWCVAAAMAFMRKADAEEQRFYEDWRPQGILKVQGRLNNEYWVRYLLHPDLNLYVSKIFEAISGAALKAKIAQAGSPLSPSDKRIVGDDFRNSTLQFARTFGWAAQVLGLPIPELVVRNDQPIAVNALASDPRASEAGRAVLSGLSAPECAFVSAKHLASYRPELYIRNLFPAQAELTVMLFAGVVIAEPATPLPQELVSNVRATAAALTQYMDAHSRETLATFVKRFVEDGAKVNIKRWSRAAELTAGRAALLLTGDLEVAKKVVSGEKATADLSAADKMKDLLVFSVSPEYSALREALGVAIRVEQ